MRLSVVLPTYNEAGWLPETLKKLDASITAVPKMTAEIIVIVDGSTDNTVEILKELTLKTKLRVLTQKNSGRFVARLNGVTAAKYESILFIDSRVHIDKNSLKFVDRKQSEDPTKRIWNSHVHVVKTGNPYARFWDAITFIAWRRYFANPRETSYGIEEFDYYPKGTTCFIAPKSLVLEAMQQFDSKSKNAKASNDDTLMIKYMVVKERIYIAPGFSCRYHSRSSLQKFLKHAYHRGRVFVDGFLRRDGNRYFLPLVGFLLATACLPLILIFSPHTFMWLLLAGAALWLFELLIALALKVPFYDALVLFGLSPLFALAYGAGIWAAALRRIG